MRMAQVFNRFNRQSTLYQRTGDMEKAQAVRLQAEQAHKEDKKKAAAANQETKQPHAVGLLA